MEYEVGTKMLVYTASAGGGYPATVEELESSGEYAGLYRVRLTDAVEDDENQLEWYTAEKVATFIKRLKREEARRAKEKKQKRKRDQQAAEKEEQKAKRKAKPGSHARREEYCEFYMNELDEMFGTLVEKELQAYEERMLEAVQGLKKRMWTKMEKHLRQLLWESKRGQNKPTAGVRQGTRRRADLTINY